jgi:hypothetical protein
MSDQIVVTVLIISMISIVLGWVFARWVHFDPDYEEAGLRDKELILTQPAIQMEIWLSVLSILAIVVVVTVAIKNDGLNAAYLALALFIIMGMQWLFYALRRFNVELNKAYILIHQKTGKQYAIVGLDAPHPTIPNVKIGQTGRRLKPSPFLTIQDPKKHIVQLERVDIKDQKITVIVAGVTYYITWSGYFEPDRDNIVSYLFKGTSDVCRGITNALSEFISDVAGRSNRTEMANKGVFGTKVKGELSTPLPANDPRTSPNFAGSRFQDLEHIWSVTGLNVNIEEVKQDEDQRQVEQGEAQSEYERRIMDKYREIKLPDRGSPEYMGYLRMAPKELSINQQQKGQKGQRGQNQPQPQVAPGAIEEMLERMIKLSWKSSDQLTVEDHIDRDGLVYAVKRRLDGMTAIEALEQAHVVTNQARSLNLGGRGGRRGGGAAVIV